jgi:hypothetical protein
LIHRYLQSPALDTIAWWLYNAHYPLVLLGLWRLFEMPARGLARIRLGIECMIVAVAVGCCRDTSCSG